MRKPHRERTFVPLPHHAPAHNGVYVLEGDPSLLFPRILYSRSEGLLGFDTQEQRWGQVSYRPPV